MTATTVKQRVSESYQRATAPVNALIAKSRVPIWPVIFVILMLGFPQVTDSRYWIRVGATVALYAILGIGLNVVAGFTGMLDMGYVAFYAVGAYTYALLNSNQFDVHLGFWYSLPIAMAATVVIGVIVGVPSLRVGGDYLAIVTLAFFQITRLLLINFDKVRVPGREEYLNITNGPNGIPAIDRPEFFDFIFKSPTHYYYLIWAFAVVVLIIGVRLQFSRIGRAWAGVRDDEITASCMGVNLPRFKVLAFITAAAIAGLAGALVASWQVGVYPENFALTELVAIYLIIILGGSGNPVGVMLGAFVYTVLGELMRSVESLVQWRLAIVSLILLLVIIFRPQGVLPARPRKSKTLLGDLGLMPGRLGGPALAGAGAGGGTVAVPVPHSERDVPPVVASTSVAEAPASKAAPPSSLAPSASARAAAGGGGSAPGNDILLEVKDLTKYFGGVSAVDGVDFHVREGEILGVIGPNGAGKTTLFNLITGIYKPDKGIVTYRGEDITGWSSDRVAAHGLGRTFQNIRVFPLLSVLDNVLTGAHPRLKAGTFRSILRTPATIKEERAAEADALRYLSFFGQGLVDRRDDYVTTLNYADRRRVEIARAMSLGPDLLLLDEPAAGMNPAEVEGITRQIRELRDQGYTIILVEHQMPVVMGVSDRILVVNKGQVLAEGTPEYIQQHEEVIKAYLGEQDLECAPESKPSLVKDRPLLRLKGVEASYGPINVLKGLDIDVYKGEIVCLLGANAAGKSTTIKTILGAVRASAGTVEFDGRNIERWPTGKIVEAGISLVPEGRRVFPRLSVLDNIKMGGYTVRDPEVIKRGVDHAFEQFPILYERRDQRAGTLSGGEQQMLALARALMTEPTLLCLDEPSMGLSPILVQQVFDIIERINKESGTTIFMVEQNANMALRIAHRGYVLQTGRIVAADEACNLLADEAMKEAYLGG